MGLNFGRWHGRMVGDKRDIIIGLGLGHNTVLC